MVVSRVGWSTLIGVCGDRIVADRNSPGVDREREAVVAVRRDVIGPLVEDPRVGRDVDRRRRRLAPPVQVDLVVGPRPPVVDTVVGRVSPDRDRQGATGRPFLRDLGIRPEREPERAGRAARRKEALDRLGDPDQAVLHPVPCPGQGRRCRRLGQDERRSHGGGDERRPTAQVDRRDAGRIADPTPHPFRLLVEHVRTDQQQQRGDAEQDQVGKLVGEGQRHVRDQDHADDDHGAQRPVMPEDRIRREHRGGPHDHGQDEDVVQVLRRRRETEDGDVDVGLDR